jgi:hypothetical protein
MAYKFNPLLGVGLDEVGAGGGAATPGGADTQVQFNDGGALGGDAGLVYDKTTDKLTVGGDIDLDDGGTFSTTLQTVTPTANRTVSIPDATGTIGLVNGPTGSIQFNEAGALKGTSDFSTTLEWNNAATTFTGLKLNVTNTASAAGSNLLDLQVNGTSQFRYVAGVGLYLFRSIVVEDAGFQVEPVGDRGIRLNANRPLGWSSSISTSSGGQDTQLWRDSAGILAQRNGTNAQTYRLYNTYTDASNYERTSITRDSSGLVIDAQKGGTGVDPTNLLDLQVNGTSVTNITSAGYVRFGTGTSGAVISTGDNGFRNIQFGGSTLGSNGIGALSQGSFNVRSTGGFAWTDGTNPTTGTLDLVLARDSAGVVKITDGSAGTGYLKLIPTTVGALTAAATVGAGTKAFVTDSTSTLSSHHGQAVVGGGTNFVPVFSDGTNWIVG